jgi:hypothetical protein
VARAVAVACIAVVLLGGCAILRPGSADDKAADAAPAPARTEAAGSAVSGLGSVKDAGELPDPCTLLSKTEVTSLTGRPVTQIDHDEADSGDVTRFCQWQQEGGQLALFLARTTESDFNGQTADAKPVDGVGEKAFELANHLYVLFGSVQIDVYSHGSDEDQNLADATEVVKAVMPKI